MTLKAPVPEHDHVEEYYFGLNMITRNNNIGDVAGEGDAVFYFKDTKVVGATINGWPFNAIVADTILRALTQGPPDG